jgi:hypothetical protein
VSIDAKIMTVVSAIKQSLQMSGGPGSSVNSHPNPFFLNVTGEMNLKHAAELIITRLEEYEAALAFKIAKLAREVDAKAKEAAEKTFTELKSETVTQFTIPVTCAPARVVYTGRT